MHSRLFIPLAFAVIACGCATAPVEVEEPWVKVSPEAYQELQKAGVEVKALRRQLKALTQRLDTVEQRVGLKRLKTSELKRPTHNMTLEIDSGVMVSGRDKKSKKRSITEHLSAFNGYVVAYWATWCKPCTSDEELRHLKDLQGQLHKHNIELLSVVIDDLDKALSDSRASRWLYPFWFVKDGHIEMLPRRFVQKVGLNLPLFLIVSKSGQIRYFRKGKLDDNTVRDIVTATASVCRI